MMFGVPLPVIMAGAAVGLAAWLSLRTGGRWRLRLVAGGLLLWAVLLFAGGWCERAVDLAEAAPTQQAVPNAVESLAVTVEQTGGYPPFGVRATATWQAPVGGASPTMYRLTATLSHCDEMGTCASVSLPVTEIVASMLTYTWEPPLQVYVGDDIRVGYVVRACNAAGCGMEMTERGERRYRERGGLVAFNFTMTTGEQNTNFQVHDRGFIESAFGEFQPRYFTYEGVRYRVRDLGVTNRENNQAEQFVGGLGVRVGETQNLPALSLLPGVVTLTDQTGDRFQLVRSRIQAGQGLYAAQGFDASVGNRSVGMGMWYQWLDSRTGQQLSVTAGYVHPAPVENLLGEWEQVPDTDPIQARWPVTWQPPDYEPETITEYRVSATAEVCSQGGQCQTLTLPETTLPSTARGYTWTPTYNFGRNDTVTGVMSVQACSTLCSTARSIRSTSNLRVPLVPGFLLTMIEYVGTVGVPFDRVLDSASGSPTITYELVGNAPTGFTYDPATRRLRGTPQLPGTYVMYQNAYGANSEFAQLEVRYLVSRVGAAPVFQDKTRTYTAEVGTAFMETLPAASGGQGSLTYSIAPITFSVMPPPGLMVDTATRVMSGTPTERVVRSFVWRATDTRGRTGDIIITVDVTSDELAFPRDAYEIDLLQGQEVMETLPFAQGGEGMVTYTLEGMIPAGTTYVASDNSLTGTAAGRGFSTGLLTATDSAMPTPATAEARITFSVASPFDGDETILDGQRYTSATPVITRTEVGDRPDGADGVEVRLWWESSLPNSGHEIEQTYRAEVTEHRVTDLGNQANLLISETDGTARYRVRTYLTNQSPHRVEVEAAGRTVRVESGATVYSAWSESVTVGWGKGQEIAVDVDADGPADPTVGRMRPPAAEAAGDVLVTLGMPEQGLDAFFALLTFIIGVAVLVAVVAMTGQTLQGVFLGSSMMMLVMFSGGTFVLGVPWYVFGAPLAILVAVTIVFYVRRGPA